LRHAMPYGALFEMRCHVFAAPPVARCHYA